MIDLIHNDCYSVIPTLEDKSIDLVITDPPYQFGNIHGSGMFSSKNCEKYGRSRRPDGLFALQELDSVMFEPSKLLNMLEPKLKTFYGYFFCNKTLVADYINWAREHRYSYDILTMIKSNPIPAHSTHHMSDTEYVILIRGKKTFWKGSGADFDCYRKWYMTTCQKRMHPAEKPVELLERFIKISTKRGDVVFDPFMGSGSNAIAALRNERSFIGIEKDNKYFELTQNRVNEFKGIGGLFEDIA